MPKTGPDGDTDYADQIAASAEANRGAWQRTLEDMEAMADELREEGWNAITTAAGHTAPTNPDAGASDRFGFVHVLPDDDAEEIASVVETGAFPQYRVFRNETENRIFVVTQLVDPDSETVLLVAGNFEKRHAPGMVKTALEEDEMYTHLQTLDGTHVASFRHDDVEKFFPNPQKYAGYDVPFDGVLDDGDGEAASDE